jgi:hypothetical protein
MLVLAKCFEFVNSIACILFWAFPSNGAFSGLHKGPDLKSGLHQNLGAAHLLASVIAMVLTEPTNQALPRELI